MYVYMCAFVYIYTHEEDRHSLAVTILQVPVSSSIMFYMFSSDFPRVLE